MTDTLTNKEIDELVKLGKDIQAGLSCDANGTGEPCRTDRLDAVSNMKRYLEIHDYDVIAPGKYEEDEQKVRTLGPNNPEGA
jgi:hypothetical protein